MKTLKTSAPKIAYIVHDINDAAVARRILMLRTGGAEVALIGFRRDDRQPSEVAGARVTDLGLTSDGRFAQRAAAVARVLARPRTLLTGSADCDLILARNIEALALGVQVKRRRAPIRLVYECLDIHRLLVGRSVASRLVQRVERSLLGAIDLLLTSSPAFLREHFAPRLPSGVETLLVENKVLDLGAAPVTPSVAPPPPLPWTIGWFGNLRCRRTFEILRTVARQLDGRVRVLIAGRASPAEFADFESQVAAAPHCEYLGAYTSSDLPALYGRCHFAWAIDFFEEGLNSSWLLPNRLYEAASAHVVPIALSTVETGRWLAARDAGLLLDQGDSSELRCALERLDLARYAELKARVAAIPRAELVAGPDDCRALVEAVVGS